MAFIVCPQCASAELRGTLSDQKIESVLGFRFDTFPMQADLDDLSFACAQWWNADAKFLLPPNYVSREVFVRDLNGLDSLSSTSIAGAGTVGLYGSAGNANNVTMCVSFRTNRTGRSYRGRNYWPLAKEGTNANIISGGLLTDVPQLYMDFFLDPAFGVTANGKWTWCVISRYNDGEARLEGVGTPITRALVVDNVVDSQRRRLPGRGA